MGTKQGPEVKHHPDPACRLELLTRERRSASTAANKTIQLARQNPVIALWFSKISRRKALLERVDARHRLTEYESVDVVRPFVGVDALEIRHVAHR